MKAKLYFLFFFLISLTNVHAQAPNWSWAKGIGGVGPNNINCSTIDNAGNLYSVGKIFSSQSITFDSITLNNPEYLPFVYLVKHNSLGHVIFAKKIEANFSPSKIKTDKFNNVYISANSIVSIIIGNDTILNTTNSYDQLLIKTDSVGNILWTRVFGSNGDDYSTGLALDDSSNIYIGGTYEGNQLIFNNDTLNRTLNTDSIVYPDVFLVKYNSNGDEIWARSVNGNRSELAGNISIDNDGYIYNCGTFQSRYIYFNGNNPLTNFNNWNSNYQDIFFSKYTPNGTLLWAKRFAGFDEDMSPNIQTDIHDNIYLAGVLKSFYMTYGTNDNIMSDNYGFNSFIAKFNNNGDFLWGSRSNDGHYKSISDLAIDTIGNSYLIGNFNAQFIFGHDTLANQTLNDDVFICKVDLNGNLLWTKSINGQDREISKNILINSFGNILVTGEFQSDTINVGNIILTDLECSSAEGNCSNVFIACMLNSTITNNSPICEGSELILGTTSIPSANYSWTGPNNFTSNEQNPALVNATANMSGAYALHVVTSGMPDIFDTTFVYIYPNPSAPSAGNNGPVCAGSPFSLSATQIPNAIYYWTGPESYNAIAQNPTMSSNTSGYYYVNAVVNGCPSPIDSTFVTIYPIPAAPEINGNSHICIGTPISLFANAVAGESYSWVGPDGYTASVQNPVVCDSAVLSKSGYYYASVSDNGCSSPSDSIEIVVNPPMENPNICIVGIDSVQQKNMVVWNKITSNSINHYNIYKESAFINQYDLIGVVPYDSVSVFIDTISNPLQSSSKYRISAVDTCNTETALSPEHKTIHLSINQGMGNTFNLLWNNYEGFTASTYNIYRGTSYQNITLLTSLSTSVNSFTDFSPPAGYVYYQIDVLSPNNCSPTKSYNYNSSKSNFASNNPNSVEELITENEINISPIPAEEYIKVTFPNYSSTIGYNLQIYSTDGLLIESKLIENPESIINVSKLASGIYFIKIRTNTNVYEKRFLKI